MANSGEAARATALSLIGQVLGGRLMTELMPKAVSHLPDSEKARAQRLALTTFRWMDRADRMLGPYLRMKPYDSVLNILRLGVVEICVDGAAPHGVLNDLVNLTKKLPEAGGAFKLVNAVLRRISENKTKWDELPVPRLPKPMRKRMVATFGKKQVEAMEAIYATGAPLDLSVRNDATDVANALGGTVLPNGSVRLQSHGQVSALPGFDTGKWWVQDAAAAVPAQILKPKKGERVLDLCAAPGGKTMQLAAQGADVTALDISDARMKRVQENLDRTGLSAQLVVADALDYVPDQHFDAILLDAPCTATGTIRRHPDLPHAKSGGDYTELFELQARLIDKALGMLNVIAHWRTIERRDSDLSSVSR